MKKKLLIVAMIVCIIVAQAGISTFATYMKEDKAGKADLTVEEQEIMEQAQSEDVTQTEDKTEEPEALADEEEKANPDFLGDTEVTDDDTEDASDDTEVATGDTEGRTDKENAIAENADEKSDEENVDEETESTKDNNEEQKLTVIDKRKASGVPVNSFVFTSSIYYDMNLNKLKEADEDFANGVSVSLYNYEGGTLGNTPVDTQVTGTNGRYTFTVSTSGTYAIVGTLPEKALVFSNAASDILHTFTLDDNGNTEGVSMSATSLVPKRTVEAIDDIYLEEDEEETVDPDINISLLADEQIVYESAQPTIAAVSEDGTVRYVSQGDAVIHVKVPVLSANAARTGTADTNPEYKDVTVNVHCVAEGTATGNVKAPTVTIPNPNGENGWFTSFSGASLNVRETEGEVATYFKIDDGAEYTYTDDEALNQAILSAGSGKHTLRAWNTSTVSEDTRSSAVVSKELKFAFDKPDFEELNFINDGLILEDTDFNNWYPEVTAEISVDEESTVVISSYRYSTDGGKTFGDWLPLETGEDSLTGTILFNKEGTFEVVAELKNEAGVVSNPSPATTIHIDQTIPQGEIVIKTNVWRSFLNNVTFGILFNDTLQAKINASDALSGVGEIEFVKMPSTFNCNRSYAEVKAALDEEGWEEYTGSGFTLEPEDENVVVYARIADKAGNEILINSNGYHSTMEDEEEEESDEVKVKVSKAAKKLGLSKLSVSESALYDAIPLTAREKKALKSEDEDLAIEVTVKINSSNNKKAKNAIKKLMAKYSVANAEYFDIVIYKHAVITNLVTDEVLQDKTTKVTKLNKSVKFNLPIPKKYASKTYKYKTFGYHNKAFEVKNNTAKKRNFVSVKLKQFSTYALAFCKNKNASTKETKKPASSKPDNKKKQNKDHKKTTNSSGHKKNTSSYTSDSSTNSSLEEKESGLQAVASDPEVAHVDTEKDTASNQKQEDEGGKKDTGATDQATVNDKGTGDDSIKTDAVKKKTAGILSVLSKVNISPEVIASILVGVIVLVIILLAIIIAAITMKVPTETTPSAAGEWDEAENPENKA
ncbi:MAG: hypothetical protein K6G65_03220, partial [Lachnospiraceae bacterium]|nr:hypothetical protein [Lachnospiraceae bacterium]